MQLLNNVDVKNDLHKRVLPSQPVLSKYLKSSQMVLQHFKYEPWFGDFELNDNIEMCQINQRKHREINAARRHIVG